jgi:hypothetical protein
MFLQGVFSARKRHGRLVKGEVRKGMRQRTFSALFLSFFALLLSSHALARVPYFVVLPENAVLTDFSDRLEKLGAVVRLRMPPNILTFEADGTFDVTQAGPVARLYRSVIPLSDLSSYGPLAEAAGIQWNRDMLLNPPQQQGFRTAGALRTQAAQSSLPSPSHVSASVNGSRLHVTWDSLAGAVSYGVQLSKAANFSNKLESVSVKPEADLPRLETPGNATLYVRVRAIDGDMAGSWSETATIPVEAFTAGTAGAAAVLTSPLDDATSDGFTVILEWMAADNAPYRVQIAEQAAFDSPALDALVVSGEFIVPAPLLKIGKTYFWRVRDWSANGSNWAPARKFVVAEPAHIQNDAMINPEAPR